jgi:hypothetical protein
MEEWDAPLTEEQWNAVKWMYQDEAGGGAR